MRAFGWIPVVAICLSAGRAATIHEDINIRSWVIPMSGIDWSSDTYYESYLSSAPAGFASDKVVGAKTLIYSDPHETSGGKEVFNLVRQSGRKPFSGGVSRPNNRSGGWFRTFAFDANQPSRFYLRMDRGLAEAPAPNDFFSYDFPMLPSIQKRRFTDRTQKRGAMKIEYVCGASCQAPNTNVIWRKIGTWPMTAKHSQQISLSSYNVPNLNIVDMTATIHSDPISGSKIHVDDLEHLAINQGRMHWRGGILWYGYGCTTSGFSDCNGQNPGSLMLNLYAGPSQHPANTSNPATSYQNESYFDGGESYPVKFSGTSQNRGWIRIEYTGTKSSTAVPYAMKTKAMELGAWDMTSRVDLTRNFSDLGIAANRISRMATVIRSDHFTEGQMGYPGYDYQNFHATHTNSGLETGLANLYWKGGGTTFIDEARNLIIFQQIGATTFFNQPGYGYSGSGNRGFLLVDYLMGSCEQGGFSGAQIQGVPGVQSGNCATATAPFKFEGGGADIWGNADEFAYMWKTASGDKTLEIKIESQTAPSLWAKSGIMIRENLTAGSRHASLLVTPPNGVNASNGAHLNWRATAGGSTNRNPCAGCANNTVKAPYYLKLQKSGTTFTASVRQSSTSAWTSIGSISITNFAKNGSGANVNYYYGLAQTANDPAASKGMANSVFSSAVGF